MRKQNYLNNKDMLKEIHKSKLSYCYVLDDEYSRFDVIVESIDDINNQEVIQTAKENRARQLSTQAYESAYLEWYDNTSRKQSQKPKQINENKEIKVSVINNGEGIPDKYIDRLTERFFRVDKARSRKIGGTGLGLAIVKHILIKHRAQLSINSIPNQETNFSITFPIIN